MDPLLLLLLLLLQVAADGAGGGYYKHMQNLDWEFAVINSPDVNAFVAPGGKVVVYTGAW
jgi:predicted Zn-dependent protease